MSKYTLEDYFFESSTCLDEFPGHHDYVSNYRSFKDFMISQIHKEVKTMTLHIDGEIYLNDHSADHVAMVMEKISLIICHLPEETKLSPYECFLLLTAIQIHDAGHVRGGREEHEKNAKVFMEQFNKYTVSAPERKIISQIAEAHSGKDDPIGRLPLNDTISSFSIRPRMLAALLRFGDELADESSRASEYLYDQGLIVEGSRLFHAFSISLNSFVPRVRSQDVYMKFNLNRERCFATFKKTEKGNVIEKYLLDEIYDRTMKTFRECLYYNRFVPESIRLHTVSVQIEFYDENTYEPFFDTISYRIEERGYPYLFENNIFQLCSSDLLRNGNELCGEYVKTEIEKIESHD